MRPRGSVIIGNSSCCSRMTGLMAERKSTASISKRALFSAPSMMSRVTASTSTSGMSAMRSSSVTAISPRSVVGGDQDVEGGIDGRAVAREDHRRRVELRDDRRAVEGGAWLQPGAVVDLRGDALAVEDD